MVFHSLRWLLILTPHFTPRPVFFSSLFAAFTAVVTSCLGIGYCVLFLNEMFITSFWFYSMFRSFLFCYFFANLPVVMGFKYFGILAGIAFAVSGVVQLSIKFVVEWGQGDCHEKSKEDCDQVSEKSARTSLCSSFLRCAVLTR